MSGSIGELKVAKDGLIQRVGCGTATLSQAASRLQGSECSCEGTRRTKKLAKLFTVNCKLILHLTPKRICSALSVQITFLVQTEVA